MKSLFLPAPEKERDRIHPAPVLWPALHEALLMHSFYLMTQILEIILSYR